VVNTSLREDFGFEHLLWVYSGRRGVHCWVCDAKARRLTNEQRTAVAEFFAMSKSGERKVCALAAARRAPPHPPRQARLPVPLHPSLLRAHETVLKDYWIEARPVHTTDCR